VGAEMPQVVNDLPAGAKRLKQVSTGISHTIVSGEVLLENNQHTGATPGQLLRV
jgi:N-acyl-D-amino-acid deacylase